VDVAGEFIYTASLLIHIRGKMLLPRSPAGPDDTPEDPAASWSSACSSTSASRTPPRCCNRSRCSKRHLDNPGFREFQDDDAAEPEIAADTVDLVRIFRDILRTRPQRPVIDVQEDSVTVGQMIQFLARRLTLKTRPIALRRLLSTPAPSARWWPCSWPCWSWSASRPSCSGQDRAFSDIFIKKHTGFDAVMNRA